MYTAAGQTIHGKSANLTLTRILQHHLEAIPTMHLQKRRLLLKENTCLPIIHHPDIHTLARRTQVHPLRVTTHSSHHIQLHTLSMIYQDH